jgi:acetate kinase
MHVLALNPGSNTLRYKLVSIGPGGERVLRAEALDHVKGPAAAEVAGRAVADCLPLGLDAIGFRIVHGGWGHHAAARITPLLVACVRSAAPLAPLHVPTDLGVIDAASRRAPDATGVAVFDCGFHRTIPGVARRYALPDEVGRLAERCGFHGIAHQYAVGEFFRLTGRSTASSRLVSLHLVGGASACAVQDGRSADTSMGQTPLEGLVMSTRCGDLDPGVVLALVRQGKTADELEELLYRRGGLLGLSGRSGDIRDLEPAAAAGNARAELALEVLGYRARKYVGAYAAALGGLDGVVLSGALAEHSAPLRERCLRGLGFLGVRLEPDRNRAAGPDAAARLSPDGAAVPVWLVPADEERQIAREVHALLTGTPGDGQRDVAAAPEPNR